MHRHDGSDGARARASRIRADHDLEATHLDSLRRRSDDHERRRRRSPHATIAALIARITTRQRRHGDEAVDAPPVTLPRT